MLVILLAGWGTGRAFTWENPFPATVPDFAEMQASVSVPNVPDPRPVLAELTGLSSPMVSVATKPAAAEQHIAFARSSANHLWSRPNPTRSRFTQGPRSVALPLAAAHDLIMRAVYLGEGRLSDSFIASSPLQRSPGIPRAAPPFASTNAANAQPAKPDRWLLDAFSFYRGGSGAEAISAGRVATYGASQTGARVQYRFAPNSVRDPRAYVRAYQALISGGESELAAGLSIRPSPSVPVRAYAEARLTDTPLLGRTVRPAAYAVTELDPIKLPGRFALELYGGAGYVAGVAATPFADGQAVATHELVNFTGPGNQPVRISVGGGAWGGVQSDAGRLDIGPTMRIDFDLGDVPARVSVDWRERVVGEAEPDSGVAATLSTQF